MSRKRSARSVASRLRMVVLTSLLLLSTACVTSPYSTSPYEYSGVRLYQVFCSSCHGLTGHGDGPVSDLVRGGVPDLTMISARHGGHFPTEDVRRTIDGRMAIAAHGPRAMPVWGFEFYGREYSQRIDRRQAEATINRLVNYLQTIQPEHSR